MTVRRLRPVPLDLPWSLHIDHDDEGDTHYQFQTCKGDVVFSIVQSEVDTPGLARAAALHIFALVNAKHPEAMIDGDAAGADAR